MVSSKGVFIKASRESFISVALQRMEYCFLDVFKNSFVYLNVDLHIFNKLFVLCFGGA